MESAFVSDAVFVFEAGVAPAWNVQGDATRAEFADEVLRQFAIALPQSPNSTTRSDPLIAFWLGPRSWLLVADLPRPPLTDFIDKRNALNALGGALFDVSASRVAFRVRGPHAMAILASGCPLDLHARAFRTGACAQSVFGRVNALVYKSDDFPTFVVMVARSFARDVRRALNDVAAQYAAAIGDASGQGRCGPEPLPE